MARGGWMEKGKSVVMDWLRAHLVFAGDECLIWPLLCWTLASRSSFGFEFASHVVPSYGPMWLEAPGRW